MSRIYFLMIACLASLSGFSQISKNMTLLAHWDVDTFPSVSGGQFSDIWGITGSDGKEYAVLGSTPYIHFFDITDASNIKELAHFAGGGTSLWREFKSYKSRVYAVADQGSEGLIIFDISNAPTITKTNQTTEFSQRTHMPFIDEKNGRLYLAGSSSQSNGLIVLDLTKDPDHPTLMASVALPGGYVHDVHVIDNIAYCSHGNNGLWVYNMKDPTNPILLGNMTSYPESGYNHSTWPTKDKKYLVQCDETHGTSVKMVDIQNLNDINVVSLFKSNLLAPNDYNSVGHNPYVRGDYAIISYYHDGVQVYNVSDPLNVKNVGWYDTELTKTSYNGYTGDWGVYPFFESDKIIASDMLTGMYIMKLNGVDLDSIHSISMPVANLNFTGDVRICKGDSINLKIAKGAQFYNWYKDGKVFNTDNASVVVKDPGVYKVVAWNHSNVAESEELNLTLSTITEPVIENGVPAGICQGDTVQLCTDNSAPMYEWFENDVLLPNSTACREISNQSKYKVIALDGACAKEGNPFSVKIYSLPDPTVTASSTILCEGDTANLLATVDAISWQWNKDGAPISGEITPKLKVSTPGVYTVSLANAFCNNESNPITITVLPKLNIDVNYDGKILSVTQSESYQWYFNGQAIPGANQINYTPTQSGTYYVVVTDLIGCETKSEEINITITATNNVELNKLNIYPNPAHNQLFITQPGASNYSEWSILNLNGSTISKGKFNTGSSTQMIDTNLLPAGTYFLQCTGSDQNTRMKFIKN